MRWVNFPLTWELRAFSMEQRLRNCFLPALFPLPYSILVSDLKDFLSNSEGDLYTNTSTSLPASLPTSFLSHLFANQIMYTLLLLSHHCSFCPAFCRCSCSTQLNQDLSRAELDHSVLCISNLNIIQDNWCLINSCLNMESWLLFCNKEVLFLIN